VVLLNIIYSPDLFADVVFIFFFFAPPRKKKNMKTTKFHQQKNNSLKKLVFSFVSLFFPSKPTFTLHIDGVVVLDTDSQLEVYQKLRSVIPVYYLNRVHRFADFKNIINENSEYLIELPSGSVIGVVCTCD